MVRSAPVPSSKGELQKLFGLGHRNAFLNLYRAEIGLGKVLKIHLKS